MNFILSFVSVVVIFLIILLYCIVHNRTTYDEHTDLREQEEWIKEQMKS